MGTALSVVIVFSLSVFIIRLATVSLRLTGLSDKVAKFQALSAFSGTGFSTGESEQIVNYPVRRKIISYLMVIGNLGLVSVLSAVVIGFVNTDGTIETIFKQLLWLSLGLVFVWGVLLNARSEKLLCKLIHRFLLSTTSLGNLSYNRLLQVGDQWSVAEHDVAAETFANKMTVQQLQGCLGEGQILSLKLANGEYIVSPPPKHELVAGDSMIIFACESTHQSLSKNLEAYQT